jgi:hypothetical protein
MNTNTDYTDILTYHNRPAYNVTAAWTTDIGEWGSAHRLTVHMRICESFDSPVFILCTDHHTNNIVLLRCNPWDVALLAEWEHDGDAPLPIVEAAIMIAAQA